MSEKSSFGEVAGSSEWKQKSGKTGAFVIKVVLAYGILLMALLLLVVSDPDVNVNDRAIIYMGFWALWICWIGICGTLMYKNREKIKRWVNMNPENWVGKFIIFAVCLLLLEEVFTVTLTNLYWVFGAEYGKAYITASDNYFETVLMHSAIVIWPAYLFWAWWLKKYDFHPNWVFILYGLYGTLGEMMYGGVQAAQAVGMWMFVYGLMIYLPAYCIPENRGAKRPKFIHYILTFLLSYLITLPFVLGLMAFQAAIGYTPPFASIGS